MRFSVVTAFLTAASVAAAPLTAQAQPASPPVYEVDRAGAQAEGESALGGQPIGAMHYLGGLALLAVLAYLIYSTLLKEDEEEISA